MRQVAVFIGPQGSGKTFNAEKLVKEQGYTRISFADSLRDIAFTSLMINPNEINYRNFKEESIYRTVTFRKFLQHLGDGVRKFDKDYFTKAIINKIENIKGNVCIDDLRFGNEFKLLYDYCRGNNIQLIAYFCNYPSEYRNDNSTHISEKMAQHFLKKGYGHLRIFDSEEILCYYYNIENMDRLKAGLDEVLNKIKQDR